MRSKLPKKKIVVGMGFLIFIIGAVIISGCTGDDDGDGGGSGDGNGNEDDGGGNGEAEFQEYDITEWSDANEDAQPLSVLEMCDLLMDNMDDISSGGVITGFTSGGFTGTGLDKENGKCPGWQVYVQRTEGSTTYRKIINIAENGWTIVTDDREVASMESWDPDTATVDSTELPNKVSSDQDASDWLSEHPNADLKIQSYHGPPIDSDETSYYMEYFGGGDTLSVYVSAEDGEIIEVS